MQQSNNGPAAPKDISLEPQPVSPEPVPVNPEPVPINPEPVEINPEPKPVSPEPTPVAPTPVARPAERVVPHEPGAVQAEAEPISLVDFEQGDPGETKVHMIGKSPLAKKQTEYNREPSVTGKGAVRCKLFHSRISLNPLENMESIINDWLDKNEIEVKHVGHLVGVLEGKSAEPNLFILVWY